MKSLQKQLPLFICLLLFLSTAKANNSSSHNSFEFLNISLKNKTFVESGSTLAKNAAVLSLSGVVNTGLWWAICKAPDFISAIAKKHQFTDLEKQEIKSIKSDFCGRLALLITKTEIALAGQVSPWPVNPLWWRPVFFMGAALVAYNSIARLQLQSKPLRIAISVTNYLTAEGLSRTIGSIYSTLILNDAENIDIEETTYYTYQHLVLATITGIMTGSITYKVLLHKGAGTARACFISAISTIVASISHTTSLYNGDFNIRDNLVRIAAATAVATALTGPIAVTGTAGSAAALAAATAGPTVGAVFGADAGFEAGALTNFAALIGALAGSLSFIDRDEMAPSTCLLFFGTAAITTGLALMNSLSGYVVYGYSLEQTFSKTTQTLWNKFLAPLDYIATLFPQLLSYDELEE